MIQIAKIPYRKTYHFPLFSDSSLILLIIYALVLILPFFIVYSVHNFYLTSVDQVTPNPTFSYTYQYHLTLLTSDTSYVYTNLFSQPNQRSLSLSYLYDQEQMLHDFVVHWNKGMGEKVLKASLLVFITYQNEESQAVGMVLGEGEGVDLSQLTVIGQMSIKEGGSSDSPAPTSEILSSKDYNIAETLVALDRDYNAYLSYTTSGLTTNMKSNSFTMKMRLKGESHSIKSVDASILGQLVWSWAQYFSIAFVFWLIGNWVLAFLFRESLIARTLKHESRILF